MRPLYLVCLLLLASCNTFRGIGEDMEAGGRALSKAASGDSNRDSDAPRPNGAGSASY